MKTRITVAALLIALLGAAEAAEPVIFINLRLKAQTQAGLVRLKQIAAVTSEDHRLARRLSGAPITSTPFPGSRKYVDRQTVAERMADMGITPTRLQWGGAARVELTVNTVCITATQILNAARSYMAKALKDADDQMRWAPLRKPKDRLFAAGETVPKLSVMPTGVRPGAKVVRTFVRVIIDGESRATIPVPFKFVKTRRYVVARRRIERGRLIRASDLKIKTETATSHTASPRACTSLVQVIGKVATRRIQAGRAVTPQLVSRPMIVRRGETVVVNVVQGPLEVVSKGHALSDGKADDVINVRIASTSKILQGRVAGPGVVNVSL